MEHKTTTKLKRYIQMNKLKELNLSKKELSNLFLKTPAK